MRPTAPACPTCDRLQQFLLGALPEQDSAVVEEHVSSCAACVQTLHGLSGNDTFIDLVRKRAETVGKPREAAVAELTERLRKLGSSPSVDTTLAAPMASDDTSPPSMPGGGERTDEVMAFLAPPQQPGEIGRLGGYRVLRVLGKGGMGVVLEGEDQALERRVALKVMKASIAEDERSKQRFLSEARAAAKVHSDHVITIHQVGEDRGVFFLAMEFLRGESLDDKLKRGERLSVPESLRVAREIAQGLAAAHEQGLIHRDIKPANVWVEPSGRVKILDFGLARPVESDAHLTSSGTIVGTPAYMAPEQARGEKIDARADLFSLGCVLYRLTTGAMPFPGDTAMDVLVSLAMRDPKPVAELAPKAPLALVALIHRLLEKDRQKRPASAQEVVDAIRAIERECKGHAEPSAAPKTAPPRRRKFVLAAVAVAAVALLAAGIVYFMQTPKGTIRIEINDPAIEVVLTQTGATIKGADKHEINLKPGEHGLHIKRGDLEFDTDKFILKKGETVTLKVEWLKEGKLQVVTEDGKVIGEKELPLVPPPHYVLEFDGKGDYVDIPNLSYAAPERITIEAWVTARHDDAHAHVLTMHGTSALSLHQDARVWNSNWMSGKQQVYVRGANIVPGERVHLAVVWDGNLQQLFVAGKKTGTPEKAAVVPPFAHGTLLGASRISSAPAPSLFFSGRIDGVRISKGARYDKEFAPENRFQPDKDTLALYRFEEGQGDVLRDSSGNGYHGKIIGAKWVKAPPPPGYWALQFKGGSNYVDVPSLKEFPGAGPFTFEAWASREQPGAAVVLAGGSGRDGFALFWAGLGDQGSWRFDRLQQPEDLSARADIAAGGQGLVHIAGVWDGKEPRLYVNGKRATAPPVRVANKDPEGPNRLLIGGTHLTFSGRLYGFFPGTIYEVRISRVARYGEDGKDFTPRRRFTPDAETLALYHFDEGQDDVLRDSSGNGHHGKIVGAKWVKAGGSPVGPDAGSVSLFNGKDLAGWTSTRGGVGGWKVIEGALTCEGPADYLMSDRDDLGDFHLRAEVKVNATGNSGIYFRAGKPLAIIGDYEAQVSVSPSQSNKTGSLFGLKVVGESPVSPDTWYTHEIIAEGNRIRIKIDGKETADYTETRPGRRTKGHIALQHFTPDTRVFFRKIEVRELGPGGGGMGNRFGAPMSPLALVARPPSIPDVDSWSIEPVGHRGPVAVVAYSKDSKRLASGGEDGTVRLWDPRDGQLQSIFLGHASKITALTWSPDGKTLASGSDDNTVRLWEADTGKLLFLLAKHTGPIHALAFSPDGKTLASGSVDKSVRLWDTATGEAGRVFPVHKDPVVEVAWQSESTILSASKGTGPAKTFWLWDAGTGKTIHSHEAQGHLAWTADRKVTVYKTADDTLAFWEVATDKKRSLTLKEHPGAIRGFDISPDGTMLATTGNYTVLWWDAATGKLLTASDKQIRNVSAVVFSPDGRTLAVREERPYVWLWKTDPVQKTGSAKAFHKNILDIPAAIWSYAWSPDSRVVYARNFDTVRFWDAVSTKTLHSLPIHPLAFNVAWAPDGKRLALIPQARTRCYLWDADTGTFIRSLDFPTFGGNVLDWARDGTLGISWDDAVFATVDVSTGKPGAKFTGHTSQLRAALWSPDSKKLATVGGARPGKLMVFDAAGGKGMDLPGEGVSEQALAWSPDSQKLATGGPEVQVLDVNTARPLPLKFTGLKGRAHVLAWSPAGLLAAGDHLGTIVVWNAETGAKLKDIQPHDGPVHALAWLPDSKTLMSLGEKDSNVCFWQTDTDGPPRIVKGLPGVARFSPDGRFLLSRRDWTRVQVWETDTGRLRGTFIHLYGDPDQYLAVSADGHFRASSPDGRRFVYVVQTKAGQQVYSPEEFARRYGWKNDPEKVHIIENR